MSTPGLSKSIGLAVAHGGRFPQPLLSDSMKGSAPNGRGRLKSVPPAPCMDMWPCPNLAGMTGEWHSLGDLLDGGKMPNEGDKQWLSLACIPKEPCICVNNDLNP